MRVAVIGAGAYGCYLIDSLIKKYPSIEITLYEVGNSIIKNEDEIGYRTNLLNTHYSGLEKGRFFGFGGTTTKWGGQLLTFSRLDFNNPSPFLKDIIFLNEKYENHVFKRFGISHDLPEKVLSDDLFIKQGVWLNYFKRDLFKYFNISKRKNVIIKADSRVVKLLGDPSGNISGLVYKKDNIENIKEFDHYFLTAGAFESSRILLNSKLLKNKEIHFSDHLSQKVFKIKGSTKIGGIDLAFRLKKGSLITKRLIGEIEGVSYFANPIFNSEFPFYQNLKNVLFKREWNLKIIMDIIKDFPEFLQFTFNLFVKKKIFVYKNEWYLYIDIENPKGKSIMSLANDKDRYDERCLNVNYFIDEKAIRIFNLAKDVVNDYLVSNNVAFEDCNEKIQVDKSEDTYHPFGLMSNFNTISEYYGQFKNLCVFNTGILPRAGGINTTAAIFPLIEEYVNNYMKDNGFISTK